MSFSHDTKAELMTSLPERSCCRHAMLEAISLASGTVAGTQAVLKAENAGEARLILKLLHACRAKESYWEQTQEKRLHKHNIYRIAIDLSHTELSPARKNCCRRAYLKGSFIFAGYLTHPAKGYHLEWVFKHSARAEKLKKLLKSLNLEAGLSKRGSSCLLYVKNAEAIARLLNLMGAYSQLLKFEEVRALKETKNYVQRRVNSETANIAKIAASAARQIKAIEMLKRSGELETLPFVYREIAALRLAHPEASLKELSSLLDPPLSKSTLVYKFGKMEHWAEHHKHFKLKNPRLKSITKEEKV